MSWNFSRKKPGLKELGVSLLYIAGVKGWQLCTALRQDNRDGQVAPPAVSVAHYALNGGSSHAAITSESRLRTGAAKIVM